MTRRNRYGSLVTPKNYQHKHGTMRVGILRNDVLRSLDVASTSTTIRKNHLLTVQTPTGQTSSHIPHDDHLHQEQLLRHNQFRP